MPAKAKAATPRRQRRQRRKRNRRPRQRLPARSPRKRRPASPENPVSKKAKFLRSEKIYSRLEAAYPDAKCALDFTSPLQLLIATILSAQSTDRTVNTVTTVSYTHLT